MAAEAAGAALVVMVAAVRDLHGAKRNEEKGPSSIRLIGRAGLLIFDLQFVDYLLNIGNCGSDGLGT